MGCSSFAADVIRAIKDLADWSRLSETLRFVLHSGVFQIPWGMPHKLNLYTNPMVYSKSCADPLTGK